MYKLCDRLSGKYIIFAQIKGKYYLWGDASCFLPVNYTFSDGFSASCFDKLVADFCGYEVSPVSKEIKYSGELFNQMPYNTTMYDEIKALVSNQYLDIEAKKYVRIKLDVKQNSSQEHINSVLKDTLILAQNTAKEFSKYYDFACPLTAGYDSRMMFAVLESIGKVKYTYTMNHKNFDENTPDIAIPKKITADKGVTHIIQDDIPAPQEIKEFIESVAGEWTTHLTIDNANTTKTIVKDDVMCSGQIIDQIGKHSTAKAIPDFAVSGWYAQMKFVNKSRYYRTETKKQIKEWKKEKETYIGDLLGWESRICRWATLNEMIYSLVGLNTLNFLNCREIFLKYISLPIKFRENKGIHKYYLKQIDDSLLSYRFNKPVNIPWYKKNWIYRYLYLAKNFYKKK